MTFEDYLKLFEPFGKITAERQASYRHQYENEILRTEDENYFEPYENDLSNQYVQNLNQIFNTHKIQENQFHFLVRPSFEPESLLVFTRQPHNCLLTYTVLTRNYWSIFYDNNSINVAESYSLELGLTKSIGNKLFPLLDKIITQARPPKSKGFTLDGVVYVLSKLSNGNLKSVYKHSPNEDSYSGRVIHLIEKLIDAIQKPNNHKIDDIELMIDELNN